MDYVYYRCTKKLGECEQKYLSDKETEKQLRKIVNRVSMSPYTAKKFLEWGKKDAKKDKQRNTYEINSLTSAIKEIDTKLERLLDGYLEKTIDRDTYQKKKNELIQKKVELEEKIKEINDEGCGWLGPFEEFVNCAYQAQKIAQTKNNGHELPIMAKTVGSDFYLLDKKIKAKYKNGAYLALTAGGVAASANPDNPNLSQLLPRQDSLHFSLRSRFRASSLAKAV